MICLVEARVLVISDGAELLLASSVIFVLRAVVLFCEKSSLLVGRMFSPFSRMSKKSFGCG